MNQLQTDEKFMRLALNEAQKALKQQEVPIGAVVVAGGAVIGRGHNLVETLADPTAHAEMQALTAAAATLGGKYLQECTLYVDQWDWERTMRPEERNLNFLKATVETIYEAMKAVEEEVYELYPHITPILPERITFLQAEELLQEFPALTPKEREQAAARKYGALFLIGIGGELSDGQRHDGRAPDYDDWSTPTEGGYKGLNGDIIVWNPVLESAFELSSMGIRVDAEALERQLAICGCPERREMEFHRLLLEGRLPLSIGGGIGQSRLCMFYLRCAHIGEVQVSIWPERMIAECAAHGIYLK